MKLTCAGQILEAAHLQPRSLQFGKISRRSSSKQFKVNLTKADGGPISPRIVNADALKGLDAKIVEIVKGEKYELETTLRPPYTGTRVTKSIEIDMGVAEAPNIRVPAFATFKPRVAADPYRFQLPKESEKKEWEGRVKLVWDDETKPKVKEVAINEPGLSARLEEKDGDQWIVVTKNDKYEAVITPRLVTVLIDDKETPTVRIPVAAPKRTVPRSARRNKAAAGRKAAPPRITKPAPHTSVKTQQP